jgi:hypothetical protein
VKYIDFFPSLLRDWRNEVQQVLTGIVVSVGSRSSESGCRNHNSARVWPGSWASTLGDTVRDGLKHDAAKHPLLNISTSIYNYNIKMVLFEIVLLVDSEIVLSTRYGKTRVFQQDLINRDHLSTRSYAQRPLINKIWYLEARARYEVLQV